MTKHTPGPWIISGSSIWNSDTHRAIYASGRKPVNERDEEGQANARLIAAAPEMLAALEALTSWAIEAQKRLPVETWSDLENHGTIEIIEAKAAIAKARGE
jgi:hypothetical protein